MRDPLRFELAPYRFELAPFRWGPLKLAGGPNFEDGPMGPRPRVLLSAALGDLEKGPPFCGPFICGPLKPLRPGPPKPGPPKPGPPVPLGPPGPRPRPGWAETSVAIAKQLKHAATQHADRKTLTITNPLVHIK